MTVGRPSATAAALAEQSGGNSALCSGRVCCHPLVVTAFGSPMLPGTHSVNAIASAVGAEQAAVPLELGAPVAVELE